MNIKPMYDHVLIKRCEAEQVTPGGLIIPDKAKERPLWGTVEAIGFGQRLPNCVALVPVQVRVGDRVLFGRYAGLEVTVDGVEYLIMRESEILAVAD